MSALPPPPLPADTDIRDLDGFMLNTDRLMASELWALSTGEEFKAAVALWCRAWKQTPPGSLPDDERVLAAFSGAGARWKKVKAMALRGFVKCSDGRLYHVILCDDVLRAAKKKAERHERTKAATAARQKQRNGQRDVDDTGQRYVDRNEVPGTGQGQEDPIPTLKGGGDLPGDDAPITAADATVMADQVVIETAIEEIARRDKLSHHVAQTYIASRCKLYGTAAVVDALRAMATMPVVAPRAWLDSRLKDDPNGAPFQRSTPSAVDRVDAANATIAEPGAARLF